MNLWVFNSGNKDEVLAKVLRFIDRLPEEKRHSIEVKEHKLTRSSQQNRYLWGVCYPVLLEGAQLEGWTKDDIHEFLLGEHFGWEEFEGFGRKKVKPIRRSSRLTKVEFMDYVDFIQRFAANHGVYIPDPGETLEAAA